MRKVPKLSESTSNNTDIKMDDKTMNNLLYLVVGVGGIILFYFCFLRKNNKIDNSLIDFSKNPLELIKQTHQICPVMGVETKNTACFQYPQLNSAFIISFCCSECAGKIQQSFNNDDKEYIIKEENNMNILYHNNVAKQVTPLCNVQNMKLVIENVGTNIMKGNGQ